MGNVSEVPAKIPQITLKILGQLSPSLVRTLVGFSDCKNLKTKKVQNQAEELVKGYLKEGNVFTLDALHCQKETTTLITQSKNDYIIALKGNQKNLLKQVVQITESQPPRSQTQAVDISHGRHLVRKVSVFDIPDQKIQEFDN
jgi:predicted transposase YbfD/YdcC